MKYEYQSQRAVMWRDCRGVLRRLALVYAMLGATAVSVSAQTSAPTSSPTANIQPSAAPEPSPPAYQLLRDEEDYSYLRDADNKGRRGDFFDPIKYIPLNREKWYLTLGGEARPYYERFGDEGWGAVPPDDDGYLLQRYLLHADFHFGRWFRTFFQLKSGTTLDRRNPPRPPDENRLDILQAFADINFGSRPRDNKPTLTLRAGRQELNFGAGRLITAREGPNVRVGFDGVRATVRAGEWRVDGFAVKPVEDDRGFFDDAPIPAQTLWGVYAVRPLGLLPALNIDLYYFGQDRRAARFDQGASRDIRHTVGTRLWNAMQEPGSNGNNAPSFDYDLEFHYQFGKFGRGDIRAFGASTNTGYTFRRARFAPRVGLETGIVSGDRDRADPDLETFHPPAPRGNYFGQIAANGPANIAGFTPTLTFKLTRQLTVGADCYFFWRQNLNDGVYSVSGNLVRTGQLSRARYIGTQPQIEAVWQIDRHTTVTVNYARFYAGRFLRETPPGRDINYFAAWVTYKF